MKDYSECIINIREFLRRTEDCFNAKNPMGAYKHTMDAFQEVDMVGVTRPCVKHNFLVKDARDLATTMKKAFYIAASGRPGPVVVESSYFLSTAGKIRLLDWLTKGRNKVVELPASAYAGIGIVLGRYAELDPDFTDAAIVWLADHIDCRAILTVDKRDFGIYRLKGGKRFEVVNWFD